MNIHSVVPAANDSDKREDILSAALDLFVERGFHGTSVPSVAERAKVAAGTIYHYFESKEALVNALFQRWKQQMAADMLRGFPFDGAPREQFRGVWSKMADFAIAYPKAFAFIELHQHGGYLDASSKAIEHSTVDFGVQMVIRAQEQQALKPLAPALLMEFAIGAFRGVFRGTMNGSLPLTRESFMQAEQLGWEALRA
jgi:TetR/AcrR family transcriptional regulator, repressor of fatR-cypB operon